MSLQNNLSTLSEQKLQIHFFNDYIHELPRITYATRGNVIYYLFFLLESVASKLISFSRKYKEVIIYARNSLIKS